MNFPAEIPVILTPRLRLRPFTAADAAAVQRLAGAREVADPTARLPHPYPEGAAEGWIGGQAAEWSAQRELALAVTWRETGELLGAIGLVFDPANEKAELGYWLGLPHWGQGFATEAASALTDYAFRVLGLQRVQAHHFARNPASGRVLLKTGLRREGVSPRAFLRHGRWEDLVFYGVVRRDWPGLA